MPDKNTIQEWFKWLQEDICHQLEQADGKSRFQEDLWERQEGGGGRTRVITEGRRFEKGGVNFSAVYGKTPANILRALNLPESDFFATGISIVIHPVNPWVPIIHMNLRYFEMSNGTNWFGGGIDLTPHYINKEDAQLFHASIKNTCDKHHPDYYPKFKKWADDYFFNAHRNEVRGIGGIFFDRQEFLNPDEKEKFFTFVKDVGLLFAPAYLEQVNRNAHKEYGEKEILWQHLRRGRYVEFNLVYDKGTKFGLETNGRIESILMSLPPMAEWKYNFTPSPNSLEEQTLNLLKKDISWI